MDHYIGLDVSLAETSICIVDKNGLIVHEVKIVSDPIHLEAFLDDLDYKITLIGLEAGQLSSWLYHGLAKADYPVVCIESYHMSTALKAQRIKTDQNDARGIAQMMRMGWYREVHVKSLTNQRYRVLLNNRRWLLGRKVDLTNQIRGNVRTFGYKVGRVTWVRFEKRIHELLTNDSELLSYVLPMLRARAMLIKEIAQLERKIRRIVRNDKVCRRLMTIPGIGPLNALAFTTAIDNPHVFKKSRDVGAFFGLTPSKYASGEIDRSGSITKSGDRLVRCYLYEAAQVLMTRQKRPCQILSWSKQVEKRSSGKKARVALARKLAVLMHRIWINGTTFDWELESAEAAVA